MNKFRVKLQDPVTVACHPQEYRFDWDWGYYQFPSFAQFDEDGRIVTEFRTAEDNITSYGQEDGGRTFASADEGKTWEIIGFTGNMPGIALQDGSRIRACLLAGLHPEDCPGLPAPECRFTEKVLDDDPNVVPHDRTVQFYRYRDVPDILRGWSYERKEKGGVWELHNTVIELPDEYLVPQWCDRDRLIQRYHFERIHPAVDGIVLACNYPWRADGYRGKPGRCPTFFISEDCGKTFRYLSYIPYEPDERYDYRTFPAIDGFVEPDFAVLPNGTIVCLMRTHKDGVKSPSYICHSFDGGKTWMKPSVFDEELGVFTTLLHLDCGVTLASYGRPGVFIRATDDPDAACWQDRICVLASKHTCSYTSMVPLGETSALLLYSDFGFIQADGKPHKTILARRIDVEF